MGSGTGSGATWSNAATLETAITVATSGTVVWLHAGTYYLSETLVIPQGVRVYGGFAGTEGALAERNFAQNRTIIDANHNVAAVTLDVSAVLDGVTVQNGVANTPTRMVGGGVLMRAESRIENSHIINNVAAHRGGGVFVEGNAEIYNSVIANNRAMIDGFAVSSTAEVLFRNNTVAGNTILDCDAYATETSRITICEGESVRLFANTVGTYLWSTGATAASIATPNLTTSTTFTVAVTTPTFCVITETFEIIVNPIPVVTVVADPTSANTSDTVTFTATANLPDGTFIWNDIFATTGPVLTGQMPAAGDLQFTVNYSVNGCNAPPVIATAINKECAPSIINGGVLIADDASVCFGRSTTLRLAGGARNSGEWVLFSGSCGGTEIARTNANNPAFWVNPITTTTFFLRGEGCGTQTTCVQTTVTVLPLLMPTTAPSNTLCVGESLTLSNTVADGGTWSIGLAGGLTITSQTPNNATVLGVSEGPTSVVFTAMNGCQSEFNLEVLAAPTPIVGDTNFCTQQSGLLTSTPAGGTWTTDGGRSATIASNGFVTASQFTGTTTFQYIHPITGCAASHTVVVHQKPAKPSGEFSQICENTSMNLKGFPPGGTWSVMPEHMAEITGENQLVSGSHGNAVVRYHLNEYCYDTFHLTIIEMVRNVSHVDAIYVGETSVAIGTPKGGIWGTTDPTVATIDPITGVFTGVSEGRFQVTYTFLTPCYYMSSQIYVNPRPEP